ncbi:hypothetical protein [Actinokineospora bangkokensis]|uniref:Sulfatase-modifying factor enzyme domain-containing protein n=1 Tax=Actinokineospora bangkokensis TaxID=1193682 RepID=A0A1Q9LLN4_9PSEU|nr:hypothetical protein [Actinokineospora bangkokensis]OLR92903.1 hypothetical protein BJP25_18170 [Actinokineospora bangkokensis]
MPHADLTAEDWYDLSDTAAVRVGTAIARETGLTLVGLGYRDHQGDPCRVAVFGDGDTRYALVPGGRVRLGHDPDAFVPTPHQAASYADSAEEWDLPPLADHLAACTSPVRHVELPAVVVAVEAVDLCLRPVPLDHPAIATYLADHQPYPGLTTAGLSSPDVTLEVRYDGSCTATGAFIRDPLTHHDATTRLAAVGTRLLTPNEWEYACGAGTPTLFRWGNDTPPHGYPTDFPTGAHTDRNRWALHPSPTPYHAERTADPTVDCGGDHGLSICGGMGFFLGWLPLAPSHRSPATHDGTNLPHHTLHVRPAIDLP